MDLAILFRDPLPTPPGTYRWYSSPQQQAAVRDALMASVKKYH